MFKDILLCVLIIWNLITLCFCLRCDGCKNEHAAKIEQETEKSLFKQYLEKEAECECLKETNHNLRIEIKQLQKHIEIKNEIIKKGDINAKK